MWPNRGIHPLHGMPGSVLRSPLRDDVQYTPSQFYWVGSQCKEWTKQVKKYVPTSRPLTTLTVRKAAGAPVASHRVAVVGRRGRPFEAGRHCFAWHGITPIRNATRSSLYPGTCAAARFAAGCLSMRREGIMRDAGVMRDEGIMRDAGVIMLSIIMLGSCCVDDGGRCRRC
jgi:hypothetical protein